MRVLIDGMNLALERGTGVATYARNLCACLAADDSAVSILYGRNVTAHREPLLREVAFYNTSENRLRSGARIVFDMLRSALPMRPYAVPQTGVVMRRQLAARFPIDAAIYNLPSLFQIALSKFEMGLGMLEITPPEPVDVAHWTYPMPIRVRGARNVYTIHDMVPLRLPFATLDQKSRHYRLLKAIARTADVIATVSEVSRADILAMLPVSPDRVVNTHQSVTLPQALLDAPETDLAAELRGMARGVAAATEDAAGAGGRPPALSPQGFYLFVGAIEPKKNLDRLLQAYLAAGVAEPLVVVGKQAWQYEDTVRMMRRVPNVIYLDYLPFAQVVTLMRTARAMLFPALYEGFGLPVLEAFLCGAPVVTSSCGATAEIAGDAALLVDPYDVGAIRDAIRRLSGPEHAALSAELIARGRRRAAAFAPERIAPRLRALYETAQGADRGGRSVRERAAA